MYNLRIVCLVAAVFALSNGGSAQQRTVWQTPSPFEATNGGREWAIMATIKGRAVSDGKTVDVSVESCDLSRPKAFESSQEVVKIIPGIVRHRENGLWRPIILGDAIPVNLVLSPGQTGKVEPFRVRLNVTDYPLTAGDTLFFDISVGAGTVPIHAMTRLPVNVVPAYCAVSMEQFKKPEKAFLQVFHICQDSSGRRRTETWIYPSVDAPKTSATLRYIHVEDPVSNLIYDFDWTGKKAFRRKGFTSPAGFGAAIGGIVGSIPGTTSGSRPIETDKWLGIRQVHGLEADGMLHTTVYPAAYQGQPREITSTEETWYAYRIKSLVRHVTSHPLHGDYEFDLKDIRLGEPDAALFRVPADYTIVDQ